MSLPRTVCADNSQHCIVAMSAPMTLVNYSHGANKRVPRGQLASIRTVMPRRPSPTPHGRRLISQHGEQPRLSNLRRWSQPFCSRSCQARSSVRAASAAPVACLQVVHLASNTMTAGTPRLLPWHSANSTTSRPRLVNQSESRVASPSLHGRPLSLRLSQPCDAPLWRLAPLNRSRHPRRTIFRSPRHGSCTG